MEPASIPRGEARLVLEALGGPLAAGFSHPALGRAGFPRHQLRHQLLMPRLELNVSVETLRLAQPFRISGHVFTGSDVVVVALHDGDLTGRGEGGGVYYLGDDVAHMLYTIGGVRSALDAGPTQE